MSVLQELIKLEYLSPKIINLILFDIVKYMYTPWETNKKLQSWSMSNRFVEAWVSWDW